MANPDAPVARQLRRWALLILLCVGVGLAVLSMWIFGLPALQGVFDWPAWQAGYAWYEKALDLPAHHPLAVALALFLLHAFLAAFALPGASLLMLFAGAGFGVLAGTLICLAGCTLGATATLLATRHWLRRPLRRWLARRFGAGLAGFDARMAQDGGRYLFSLRVLPVIPFALVNVAAGLSAMHAWTFTWISFAGMAAGTFLYVNAGAELGHAASLADLASPSLLLSLLTLAILPWLLRRQRANRNALHAADGDVA